LEHKTGIEKYGVGLPGSGILGGQAKVGIVKTPRCPVPKDERGGYEQKNDNSPDNIPESKGLVRGYGKKQADNVKDQEDHPSQSGSPGKADLPVILAGQSQAQDDRRPNRNRIARQNKDGSYKDQAAVDKRVDGPVSIGGEIHGSGKAVETTLQSFGDFHGIARG